MPIPNFEGQTFVAFVDLSGFKELMKQEKKAWKALDSFYNIGYSSLLPQSSNQTVKVEGLFISDCGVLFVRNGNNINKLKALLNVISDLNKRMLEKGFMLTSSICYGQFKYQERIEFEGIEKNLLLGNAYLAAYLDSERTKPHIQAGQCRIVTNDLPSDTIESIESGNLPLFRRIIKESPRHYYFYWSVRDGDEIENFKKEYRNAYNLKFSGMFKALKGDWD